MDNLVEFLVFWVIFMIIFGGLGLWLERGSKAEIDRRSNLQKWPVTKGVVVETGLEQRTTSLFIPSRLRFLTIRFYIPLIHYSFEIMGKLYQSSRYKNAYSPFNRSGQWNTIYPQKAERIIAEHPAGKPVSVTYNPDNPEEAYLSPETSTTASWAWRAAGFICIAVAVLLFFRGGYLLGADLVSKTRTANVPAVIPAAFGEIKAGLETTLELTCQVDKMKEHGPEVAYKIWLCEDSSPNGTAVVWIYSRENSPDQVDYLLAVPGKAGVEKAWSSLGNVAALTAHGTQGLTVNNWVTANAPGLKEKGDRVEMTAGEVKYVLSANITEYFKSLKLEIGEMK